MSQGLHPYASPEERDQRARASAEALKAEVREIGRSVEGRPILAVRVPQAERDGVPDARVLVTGNIHGPEYVSAAVALGVLERMGSVPGWRRLHGRAEVWVVPCLNPDGYARTWNQDGRGALKELRPNAHGVDLNRNFPLPNGERRRPFPGAGSTRPGAATYVGAHPLSEPETAAIAALLGELRFDAGTNGHSFMGSVIPPRVRTSAEVRTYAALARALRAAQGHSQYFRLSSRWFDTYTGELEDFQHHHHRMWAICVETFSWKASFRQHLPGCAPSLFWRFNPRDPAPWIDNDVPALAAFLNAALDVLPRSSRVQGTSPSRPPGFPPPPRR